MRKLIFPKCGSRVIRLGCLSLLFIVSCKKNSGGPIAAAAPTIFVNPQLTPPGGQATDAQSIVPVGGAFSVEAFDKLPACGDQNKGSLGYALAEKKFYVCDSAWKEVALESGSASASAKLVTRNSEEPPGENCKYGGKKVQSGIDADASGVLEDSEVGSTIYSCDGGIEGIAQKVFEKTFKSIGIVVSTYSHPFGCTSQAAGTGWMVSDDVAVTNQHVVESVQATSCFGLSGQSKLTGVKIYFPKTKFDADTLLRQGLPNYAGFSPSLEDFDEFNVTNVDRSPTANSNDKADLAFLQVSGTGRASLTLSTVGPTSVDSKTLRTADQVFSIGYSVVQGPRLSVGQVFDVETCEALMRALSGSDYQSTDCLNSLNVNAKSLMFSYFGYGDHGGSGSPIFDRFGDVVGVHTWGANAEDAPFNAAQSVTEVKRFLVQNRVWKGLMAP